MNSLDIKKYRKAAGLTQEALAEKLGVTKRTIINYEKGELIPDSKVKLFHHLMNEEHMDMVSEPIETYRKGVPYYDVDFTSSFLEVENNQSMTPTSYINHPFFFGCDLVVRNSGQSMAKLICHGDAVGLVKINDWQDFFPLGEVYAIVTKNNFRMIKIITKGDDKNHYTLISKPTDSKKDEFPPQQIKIDSILHIFKVQASSHLF
jgi:DNA-binding XRE family transcriptional regulator